MFISSFMPIADDGSGDFLFVDLRKGGSTAASANISRRKPIGAPPSGHPLKLSWRKR
jgi:hypothetical protein